MKDAADFFSAYLDRPVIDRTGLDRLGLNLESTTAPFDVLVIEPRSSPN